MLYCRNLHKDTENFQGSVPREEEVYKLLRGKKVEGAEK
jgi:hypothetical protein